MVNVQFNKGERLIVVHAGSVPGFVSGAKLIFKANTSTGDYNGEMIGEIFTKWLNEKLIPNLLYSFIVDSSDEGTDTASEGEYSGTTDSASATENATEGEDIA
jgi:hypothetical protein